MCCFSVLFLLGFIDGEVRQRMSFAGGIPEQPVNLFREPDRNDSERRIAEGRGVSFRGAIPGKLILQSAFEVSVESRPKSETTLLDQFLKETSWAKKFAIWFGEGDLQKWSLSKNSILRQLERDIAKIDGLVSLQLNGIMHHDSFKRLEASWRGLEYLVACKDEATQAPVQIKVWNVTWSELKKDQEGAMEFDQSAFFKKIYEEALGTPGVSPFSVILADFDIHPRPSREHPFDDIEILQRLSETAAAAFAPLLINASPSMFGVDKFHELRQSFDLEKLHTRPDFLRWQQFRTTEESRFVSVLLPRMLLRKPYRPERNHHFGFPFEELPKDAEDHIWGGAIFGMGEVLIRAFAESRWFANIRGVQRGIESGGLVVGPTMDAFETESDGLAPKAITESVISDAFERQLAKLGFISLCACANTPFAAFYSCPSVQKPGRYTTQEANANAELSALTNYMLCASRFGHYVKVMARDKIGALIDAGELQEFLSQWLINYVNRDPDASPRIRAEKPLLDGDIQVRAKPGRPGEYDCIIQLEPYHSFDEIRASLKLDTKLVNRNQ